jgi:hypothetical protein
MALTTNPANAIHRRIDNVRALLDCDNSPVVCIVSAKHIRQAAS